MSGIVRAPDGEPNDKQREALYHAAVEKEHREYMEKRAEHRNELIAKVTFGAVFLWGFYMTYQILSGGIAI